MIDNHKECILCAAIWYKELPMPRKDLLHNFRPKNVYEGAVFSGWRHPYCIYQMAALTGLKTADAGPHVQGFLTSRNRFLDRKESAELALKVGQVEELQYTDDELFSEDLY